VGPSEESSRHRFWCQRFAITHAEQSDSWRGLGTRHAQEAPRDIFAASVGLCLRDRIDDTSRLAKIPALMDRSGQTPVRIFESGAILNDRLERDRAGRKCPWVVCDSNVTAMQSLRYRLSVPGHRAAREPRLERRRRERNRPLPEIPRNDHSKCQWNEIAARY
jgi:hypothetical protein